MQEGGGLIGGRAMSERVKVFAARDALGWVASEGRPGPKDSPAWLVFAPHDADPLAALEAERDEARAFAHAANGTAQRLAGELEEARSGFKGLLAAAAARLSSEDLDRLGNLGQVEFGCWNGLEGPASACAECREAFRRALVAYLVGEQSPLRAGHPDELGGEAS